VSAEPLAPLLVGIQPRLPGALGRWRWLLAPVPAERVAALRVAVAVCALLDLFVGTLPQFHSYYRADALGGSGAFESRFRSDHYYWSLLRVLPDEWGPQALFALFACAAGGLLVGWRPLVCGLVCWACAVSFWNINNGLCNGGDQVRNALFLAVALAHSGAAWGVGAVRHRGPVLVPGWPVKVLLVQFCCLYVFSGIYKLMSNGWQSGYVMYYVNHDLEWCLTPNLSELLPVWVHRASAWGTIAWELGFPVFLAFRRARVVALWLGAFFHVVTFITLEVGHFALYSLAFYAVFVPWESWSPKFQSSRVPR
jgi:Vitamin K-dependent gamma-carboxylase